MRPAASVHISMQQWLRDAGTEYPLITGGYKAPRQAVIQVTEELVARPGDPDRRLYRQR